MLQDIGIGKDFGIGPKKEQEKNQKWTNKFSLKTLGQRIQKSENRIHKMGGKNFCKL